jgi:hypothetical protein
MGQCWRNARQALVLGDRDRRLTYCEGFLADVGTHHAWLTLAGKVVDITLNTGAFGLKAITPRKLRRMDFEARSRGRQYFGVAFPRQLVEAAPWREPVALADYCPNYPLETLRAPWSGGGSATIGVAG